MSGTIHLHSNKASAVPDSSASMMFATQKWCHSFACLLVRSAQYDSYNSAFCAVASKMVVMPFAHSRILLFVTVRDQDGHDLPVSSPMNYRTMVCSHQLDSVSVFVFVVALIQNEPCLLLCWALTHVCEQVDGQL